MLALPTATVPGGAGPPQVGAAAGEKDSIKVYETAKSAMTNLKKHVICGNTFGDTEADEVKRKAIIDGLENTLDFVQMLDDYADDLLDIGGDWTEGSETWPMLEDVLVVPAARAPGDERPPVEGDVKKRPQNDFEDNTGPARVKLSFEDGQQAFDAPVTAAEIEDNTQRLLDFLNDDDTSHDVVAEDELGTPVVSLRLDRERELVQLNGGKLLPRMLPLTLSGVLSRQLDVIKEGRTIEASATGWIEVQKRRHGMQANADLRARLRACTQETKALPLAINLLATPGAEVSDAHDGTVTVVLPAITCWPIDDKIDNLAGRPTYGAFVFPMRTPKSDQYKSGVNRNANNLVGGVGAGGGDRDSNEQTRVSATNAERRLSMNRFLFGMTLDLHQTCGASLLEDFVNYNEPPSATNQEKRPDLEATSVKMNVLSITKKNGQVVSPRRQGAGYEISAGKLRMQLPHCVLDVIIRIFGDKGLIDHGRPRSRSPSESAAGLRERLWIKFFGNVETPDEPDEKKCKVLAAKLLLHALRYADYDNIKKDLTRRVLSIFTDLNLERFWGYAFGGIEILMEGINAFRQGTFVDRLELVKASVGAEVITGKASESRAVLSRIMSCLSTYEATRNERGSLTKIAGKEVAHGVIVRKSLRTSFRRVTGDYVADLTKYHKASKKACESLVLGAEHILRLRPQVLESNQSLRDRSVFSKIIKTRLAPKPGDNSKSFVHLVYLRVSDEDTVMSETRFGFSVQLDMWKAQYMADQTAMLDFPSTEDHHVVWIVSVQSRIADDQLRDPVAIFEEDSSSDCRLPDLKTMKTATVGTAIGVVLAAEGKNREGRLVTMSAMYAIGSDRVTLEAFTNAVPASVRVVGFDALDLRPLIGFFPEIALPLPGRGGGWRLRMINVESGTGGNALVAHRLGAALAMPSDLNVLRHAGFEAVNQDSDKSRIKTNTNMTRVAECTAKPLNVFQNDIVPRWFEAVVSNANGPAAAPGPLDFERESEPKLNMIKFDQTNFTSVLRHSGLGQMWRSQHQMLSWVGGLELNKVYLRPFPATIDLTTAKDTDDKVRGKIQLRLRLRGLDDNSVENRLSAGKIHNIKNANIFASMSRAANPGVLEHAHDNKNFFCLVDIAIAVKEKILKSFWVRDDKEKPSDGCDFARRTNLRNEYVYAVLRAIRDSGHLPHRHLLGELVALGRAGSNAEAASAGA